MNLRTFFPILQGYSHFTKHSSTKWLAMKRPATERLTTQRPATKRSDT